MVFVHMEDVEGYLLTRLGRLSTRFQTLDIGGPTCVCVCLCVQESDDDAFYLFLQKQQIVSNAQSTQSEATKGLVCASS